MKTWFKLFFVIGLIIATSAAWILYPLNLGLDLQGGTQLILETKNSPDQKIDSDTVTGVLEVIRNRVDIMGVSEPIIQKKGLTQIIVELPGVKDPEHAIKLVGETALLEFIEAEWAPPNVESLTNEQIEILAGPDARLATMETKDAQGNVVRKTPIFLKKTVLTGANLASASPGTDNFGRPIVNIEFKPDGAKTFYDVTARATGKPIAILLDGVIISAPNVNEPIGGGRAQISGNFSISEMRDLVVKLKAGALPVPVTIVSNKIVGPTLGKDSIEKSKVAGMIGVGVVIVFMLFIYRLSGLMAGISLILYIGFVIAVLKLMHATLTLPGIAGIILSIGMAVDANVIIFERIKEELRAGLSFSQSISKGFSRAFTTILDANITTLISAIVLFWLGKGTIKGFAVTLSIGLVLSMFTAIFVTRALIDLIMSSTSKQSSRWFIGVKQQ